MRIELYRLTCLRYIFLIYLGLIWAKRGICLNTMTFCLSVISIIFIAIFQYTDISLEPFLYHTGYPWEQCHWIGYFYPAFLFMFILKWAFDRVPRLLKNICIEIGHYSWEIFLVQMFFFTLFPRQKLMEMGNYWIMLFLFSIIAYIFSIIPVILVMRRINKSKSLANLSTNKYVSKEENKN